MRGALFFSPVLLLALLNLARFFWILVFSYTANVGWLTAKRAAQCHIACMTSNARPPSPSAQPVDKTDPNTAASPFDPPAAGKGIPARTPEAQAPLAGKHLAPSDQSDQASLQMPHERDQNTGMTSDAKPEPRIKQASEDLEQGRKDTSKAVEMDMAYKKL